MSEPPVIPRICPRCQTYGEIEVEVVAWMTHTNGEAICINEHAGVSDKEHPWATCCNCGHLWQL